MQKISGGRRSRLWFLLLLFFLADCALLIYVLLTLSRSPQVTLEASPTSPARPAATAARPVMQPGPTSLLATETSPVLPTPMETITPLPAPTQPALKVDVEALLAKMSLEQKAGQMIIAVLPGQSASGTGEDLVAARQIGGFVLYGLNVADPQQTFALTHSLQALAAKSDPVIPLFISMDHEGGGIYNFQSGVTHFPWPMALAATHDPQLVYQAALASGRELRAMGINCSLGPVLDVNVNPNNPIIGMRAFSDDPQLVAVLGERYISGLRDGGVIAVAKHFPGHGDTTVDSHSALPEIDQTLAQLQARDLLPFERAIQLHVPGIMVGHIANAAIDPSGRPASLSAPMISGLLRQQMGYQGVVLTDALTMGPIRANYSVDEVTMRAIQAGNDMLMFTNPADAAQAQKVIMQAVKSGNFSEQSLNDSVRRILVMKARAGLFDPQPARLSPLPLAEDEALAHQIDRQAIYAQGQAHYPLLQAKQRVLLVSPDWLQTGSQPDDNHSLLGELLQKRGFQVDEWIYPVYDAPKTRKIQAQVLEALPQAQVVIMATWDARRQAEMANRDAQIQLLQALYASGKRIILVVGDLPYDLTLAPAGQPALVPFGNTPLQMEALVDALLADQPPPGVLPVKLK